MTPFGTYWASSSLFPDAAYVVCDDLIFTACHFDQNVHSEQYYTEHDEPTPEEVRSLASLALPIGEYRGFMAQYPDMASLKLDSQLPLDDPYTVAKIEQQLRQALAGELRRPPTSPPLPPCEYCRFHWPLPHEVHRALYTSIDVGDHLLIRGLGTWLKSSMMHMHYAFAEEANYPPWISLDASLALIFDALRESGVANPSVFDAQNFVHDAFGEERSGTRYFEEFYEDRIMTMHPQNRFGTFAFAPIGHDDFYWLHNGLREVYRYILLGKVIDPQAPFDSNDPQDYRLSLATKS